MTPIERDTFIDPRIIGMAIQLDPPFDECAGVDLNVAAWESAQHWGRKEPEWMDYYEAFVLCCSAILETVE